MGASLKWTFSYCHGYYYFSFQNKNCMKKPLLLIILLTCFTLLHAQDTTRNNAQTPTSGEPLFTVVEQMPEFPGGPEALMKFIKANIQFPLEAFDMGIQGKVVVEFSIEQDGHVDSISIKKSVWPSMDAEAMRVVGLLPPFKPGTQQGKAVRVKFTLPISMMNSDGDLQPLKVAKPSDDAQIKAVAAYEKKKYALALKLFKEVYEHDPANNFAAHNLGLCLYNTGDKDGACTQWTQLKDKGFHTADFLINKYCK